MRPRRPLRTLALGGLVALAVSVSACSSDDDGSAAERTTTTASSDVTPVESGDDTTTTQAADTELVLTSSFEDGEPIPGDHACAAAGGKGTSPEISWAGVPSDAENLVLVVHDPDAPMDGGFTHLVTTFPAEGSEGSFGVAANQQDGPMEEWIPMCPPSGTHRYVFTLYAFGPGTDIPEGADKADIDALLDEVLAEATVTGTFTKPS